jgi:hypothetical protein
MRYKPLVKSPAEHCHEAGNGKSARDVFGSGNKEREKEGFEREAPRR